MQTVKVSISNLNNFERAIRNYVDDIYRKLEILCKKLTDEGVEVAKAYVDDVGAVFNGDLLNSISSDKEPGDKNHIVFVVKATSEHAIFVEMGTGKVGAETPYPGNLPVMYAQGKHIFKTKDGRYGWIYFNEKYNQWVFTEGMMSRPFMYQSSLYMQRRVVEIAREVFGNG